MTVDRTNQVNRQTKETAMTTYDNGFDGCEPTSEDIEDWQNSETIPEPHLDPFVSFTKEGDFWAPAYVFTRQSGQRLELNSKQYSKLVNSQK